MKKLVFIAPHLSTGGMPQYLLKQIQSLTDTFDVYCIEWQDITGGKLVVQRNKVKNILQEKLFSLGENKNFIFEILNEINPDIIHFQEIPETFIDENILDKIYTNDRVYSICVTTHTMYTNPATLKYTADKFILVSEWSKKVFENYFSDISCEVWDYPVEKWVYDKNNAKKELNWDPNYKHVLHVGLFTPGKNQKHIINLAKLCLNQKIIFHFVGNQAENFKEYWKDIRDNLPKNCIWHNERSDVEKYYKAADLFYFPSEYELNPISIKEALSAQLHLFITKLETYENIYDNVATYVTNNLIENKKLLLKYFNMAETRKNIALHILTDIDTDREIKSLQSLSKLEDYGFQHEPIISKRYKELPPSETCQYPEKISLEPGGKLTPGHYGCYLGHRKAFETGICFDSDYIIIFECDAVIDVSYDEFVQKVEFAYKKTIEDNLLMFSFGFHNNTNIIEKNYEYFVVDKFYGAHAYLIPKKSYDIIKKMYETAKWNVTDLLFCDNLSSYKIGIFETPITKQVAGYSILDKIYNNDRY